MLEPAATQDVELGIIDVRPLDEAGKRRPLQCGEVFALEIADQVGRRVDGLPVDQLHHGIVREADDS
jgi:hypothetical protein